MSTLLIQNALLKGEPVDLLVKDGKVAELKPKGSIAAPADATRVDGKEQVLFPSFIDAHVHLREPGFEWKEDVASGLTAAAHGGFGAVMCMANTDPINDEGSVTVRIINSAREAFPHGPRVYPIGAATVGLKGQILAPMAELKAAGCVAVSNDGIPVGSSEIFRRVMEYAEDLDLPVIDHCEDPWLAKNAQVNEGEVSGRLGLRGQPDVAEAVQAMRDIMLAEYLNTRVHIAHVSAARTVEVIAWGKARGVKVTAETTPHYLTLDETEVLGYRTFAKINPPLRTQKDIAALRAAVKDGTIDILVTDHSPHALHEKEVPFDQAPNGFTGLELALSVTYGLVRDGVLSEADLIRLWCTRPSEVFKLPINTFKPGDPANFFLFDPAKTWEVTRENLHSKSWNTPWFGKTLSGRVTGHWLEGHKIV